MTSVEVLEVLGLCEPDVEHQVPVQEAVCVVRKLVVEEGHEGEQGRTDLVLQLGQWGIVVLEVKKRLRMMLIRPSRLATIILSVTTWCFEIRGKPMFCLLTLAVR